MYKIKRFSQIAEKNFGLVKTANKALKSKAAVDQYRKSTNPEELAEFIKSSEKLRLMKLKNPAVDNSSEAVYRSVSRKYGPKREITEPISFPVSSVKASSIHSEIDKNASNPGIVTKMLDKKRSNTRSWKMKNRYEKSNGIDTRKNRV